MVGGSIWGMWIPPWLLVVAVVGYALYRWARAGIRRSNAELEAMVAVKAAERQRQQAAAGELDFVLDGLAMLRDGEYVSALIDTDSSFAEYMKSKGCDVVADLRSNRESQTAIQAIWAELPDDVKNVLLVRHSKSERARKNAAQRQ